MSEFDLVINNYWNYYLDIEKEIYNTKKYVEFHKGNYKTFSIEYLKIYQTICSEIDNIAKVIVTKLCGDECKPSCIPMWWYYIQDYVFNYLYKGIKISNFAINNYLCFELFEPWKNFHIIKKDGSPKNKSNFINENGSTFPKWWSNHNKVKHSRLMIPLDSSKSDLSTYNYQLANLENVMLSLAALYSLEIMLIDLTNDCNKIEAFINSSIFFAKKSSIITTQELENILK